MIYSKKDKEDFTKVIVSNVIRTLLCGGFQLIKAESKPGFFTLICHKLDEFGSELRYCFIVASSNLNRTQVKIADIEAKQYGVTPVVIGEADGDMVSIEWEKFALLSSRYLAGVSGEC